jgi:hypothetical protein
MSIRPIFFSAPMIQALLDGRKSQTRRMKTKIQTGDLLWVTETYCPYSDGKDFQKVYYLATSQWNESHSAGRHEDPKDLGALKWRSFIFMRRKHSRITLEVTEVRKEKLKDISAQDAIAEGVRESVDFNSGRAWLYYSGISHKNEVNETWHCEDHISAYKDLWGTINSEKSWESNPEVFVITFKTYIKNIDEFLKERNVG